MVYTDIPFSRCVELLKGLFSTADELHRQLILVDLREIAEALTAPASLDTAAFEAVEKLNKRGALASFLEALVRTDAFRRRRNEIEAVFALLAPKPAADLQRVPRILLLADLQVGMPGKSHIEATASLVDAICHACVGQQIDGVCLLGDLVWSGKEHEYETLTRQLIEPLRADPTCQGASWIAVPGNHDLDCDVSYVPIWDLLGPRRDVFFADTEEGRRARKPRAPSFLAFERFVRGAGIRAPLPSERVATPIEALSRSESVGVVLINTAWFSDPSVDTSGRIPAPIESLREVLTPHDSRDGTLVIGHHPIDEFRIHDRTGLRTLLREHQGLYMHGHVAGMRVLRDNDVLREIGLGVTSRHAGEDRFVSNTFALVGLGPAVEVMSHRWGGPAERWQPADDSTGMERQAHGTSLPWRAPNGRRSRGPELEVGQLGPRIDGLSYIGAPSPDEWKILVQRLRLVAPGCDPRAHLLGSHEVHFYDDSTNRRRLLVCLAGSGRVLSESEILEASNALDIKDYDEYVILTFGDLADEAQAAYERLREKKPLRVVSFRSIIESVVAEFSPRARALVQRLDPTQIRVRLVFFQAREHILLSDVTERWIELHDAEGEPLPDTAPVVRALRELRPVYAEAHYGRALAGATPREPGERAPKQPFDAATYRAALFEEFNNVRYAPLAALGLGFSRTTLNDLYVDTTAQMEESASSDAQLARALDEVMEGLEVDPALREQLRHSLRSSHGVELLGETDLARRLYQKHGSLLVLGNPGSGKTFFAKHQLLAYCRPPAANPGWYARHLPVYVSLAEAAKHLGEAKLLDIASHLPKLPSLAVPARELHELYADGRLALFLDGLDEVTSIAQRSQIADQLAKFLEDGRARN